MNEDPENARLFKLLVITWRMTTHWTFTWLVIAILLSMLYGPTSMTREERATLRLLQEQRQLMADRDLARITAAALKVVIERLDKELDEPGSSKGNE